jgi:hypothetical protein
MALPSPSDMQRQIDHSLRRIVGLPVCLTRRGGAMRAFHFGAVTHEGPKSWGTFALHIQCAWRLEGPAGIVAGSGDFGRPVDSDRIGDSQWDPDTDGNVQDFRVAEWLDTTPGKAGEALPSNPEARVVRSIASDRSGGLIVQISDGCRLLLFPDSAVREAWRFIQVGDSEHLVVMGFGLEE